MITTIQLKQYFWYIFGVIGVVFFWAGVWDGIGYLPYLENPWLSIMLGLVMITLSGFIFKGSGVFTSSFKGPEAVLHKISRHPQKHEFHIRYKDKIRNKHILIKAGNLDRIEKGFLVLLERRKEFFIPIHRVVEVLHKGKTHWKG